MKLKNVGEATKEELLGIIRELEARVKKKNEDLTRTRQRLNNARNKVQKLKDIVTYQRDRIIQLHE